jgi:membrane-bound lytic murein transglycosylase D
MVSWTGAGSGKGDVGADYLQELDRFGGNGRSGSNTGELGRAGMRAGGGARGHDSLFWRIAPHLPRETRNYVPLMLAAGHIAKEPGRYGFEELEYQEPLAYDIAWVPGPTDLTLIAEAAGVEHSEVVELNPHLTHQRTPSGRGWPSSPRGSKAGFTESFPRLYRLARAQAEERRASADGSARAGKVVATHRVAHGETLDGIARRYGVSVKSLRAVNGNVEPRRLRAGRTLKLPASAVRA